jgi:hypothetical protein
MPRHPSSRSHALGSGVTIRLVAGVVVVALLAGAGGCGADANRRPSASASAGAVNPRAIPLGDGRVSTTPKVGYVDSCRTHFGGIGGAQVVGPWIDTSAKTWDSTTKAVVQGHVRWPNASYTVSVAGSKRVLRFNDLPINHTTGSFPIASSDPAYAYDRNPNRIAAQSVSWRLPLNPVAARKRSCTGGGPIGVLTDGAFLFNALDGEGRDAAAHEVLDACAGHPEPRGAYHHHDVPPCILNAASNGQATLVGYALDGYGIYVVKDAAGNLPRNRSLDACHGTTSVVPWNGGRRRIYHYVATLEYPYTVGCYHGSPISTGPPGGGGPGGPPGGPPPGA